MAELLKQLESLNDELQGEPTTLSGRSFPHIDVSPHSRPYPGLRPFLPGESQFFKGRDTQIREIGKRLATQGCVSVLGGSGCGKSSIVRAGVIPALRRKLIPGRSDLWRAAIFTPGREPIKNLVDALAATLKPPEGEAEAAERARAIREVLYGPDRIGGFLSIFRAELVVEPGMSRQAQENANLFIVVDQFEELFRRENKGMAQCARLVELVVDCWKRRREFPGLYLALTMRTDDLHRCAEYIDLPDLMNATAYLTRRLKEDELLDAIVAPVRPPMFRAGLIRGELSSGQVDLRPYEVAVVTELLDAADEIGHDPDHLPLLQHLLNVLWRLSFNRWRQEAGRGQTEATACITLNDLARAVGYENWELLIEGRREDGSEGKDGWLLRRCLNHAADELYGGKTFGSQLSPKQQLAARTAFCLMGMIDDRGNFKRRWTNSDKIALVAGHKISSWDIEIFIRRFSRDHRMIWVRDNGVMDVSHEALMRNWDRLSRWLIENREAGKAYLELAHKYEKWKRSSRHQSLFLSWFKRKNGLAGSEMVEHLKPLLTVRTRKGYKASPRYNRFWAQRFLDYGIQPGGGAGEQIDKDEAALLDSNYRNQFKYLKVSIWKENFKRVGWPLGFFIFFLLSLTLGTLSFELYENQRQIIASNLWNQLEGWEPVIKQEYVNGLWQVSMSENSVLTQFVKQIPEGSHIKQLGFRPQPIARAIGWRWSPELRKIALNFLKAEVEKTSIEDKFTLASLASMVAVLGDYIPPELQERAIDRFRQYIGETEPSSLKVWTSARILACLEDKLDASSSSFSDTIIQHIFKSSDKLIAASSGWPLGQIAAGLTSAAWFIKDVQKKALSDDELSTIRNMTDKIISHLENNQDDFLSFMLARPLVSLISVLPSMDQAQLLVRMFRTVSNWPERTNPDLLLIFAQAFDRAGDQIRKSGGNHGYEGLSVIVSETAHKIDGNLILRPSHKIEMLRLAVPIAVAGDDAGAFYESATKALDPRTDLAAKMAQAKEGERSDPETEARMHFTDEELLPLGLSGRLFSILAEADQLPDSIDPNVVMSNITEALKNINMMAAVNTNDTQNFAREGLAHAISALALNPRLDEIQNQQALEYAKDALARTGSAEEAATWATAIVNLLKDEQINEFVEAIANLIKYPTAALTAREPNAREPKNATDIFILSLIRRPELKQVLADTSFQPQLAHQREILAKIIADERFSDIRLEAPPIDPRR